MTEEELNLEIKNIPKIRLSKKLKVFLLLLVPLFFTIFFRAYTYNLPYADSLAQENIDNILTNQIKFDILNSYPSLSEEQINSLTSETVAKYKSENQAQLEQQRASLAQQIRDYYQDEKGRTYILSIDPFSYILETNNFIFNREKQHQINEYYPSVYNQLPVYLHPYLMIYSYKLFSSFLDVDVTDVSFALPMIISALAVIPAFFITRRLAGNVGGLFGALMFTLNTTFLSRTVAGAPDNDPYNVLFPLLIIWVLMESFIAKTDKNKLILAASAGILTGIFSFAWTGWWYIFDFIIGSIVIYLLFIIVKNRKNLKESLKEEKRKILLKNSGVFLLVSALSVSLITSFKSFYSSALNPLTFTSIQNAARTNYYPNVYTTVAELNRASFDSIISSIGGTLYFFLSILGIILIFWYWRKKTIGVLYSIILAVWFVGTIYAATQGVRFIMNFAPAFSIAFGSCLGLLYYKVSETVSSSFSVNKKLIKVSLFIVFIILMIQPIKAGDSSVRYQAPLMNDDWYYVLEDIKASTPEDTIIASWWDYGWWFMSNAERQVIFNGGSQNKPQAHWIGKSLITTNEKESVNILRMLVCSKNAAFETLMVETNNNPVLSYEILDKVLKEDRNEAKKILEQYKISNSDKILDFTHCENPPNTILVTSEDMVAKSGVWGHFGLWNFEKSYIYLELKGKSKEEFVSTLQEMFGYSNEEAAKMYNEFSSLRTEQDFNSWIAPYPGYSGSGNCENQENRTICSNGLIIQNNTGYISTGSGFVPLKTFITKSGQNYGSENGEESIAAGYNDETGTSFIADPLHLGSVFQNLFFFKESKEGYYTLLYESNDPGNEKIYVWQVNFAD